MSKSHGEPRRYTAAGRNLQLILDESDNPQLVRRVGGYLSARSKRIKQLGEIEDMDLKKWLYPLIKRELQEKAQAQKTNAGAGTRAWDHAQNLLIGLARDKLLRVSKGPCKTGSCSRRNFQGGCDVPGCLEPAAY